MIKLFLTVLIFSLSLEAKLVDKVLAIVSDDIITLSDLNAYKKKLKAGRIQDDLFTIDRKKLLASNKALLQQLIDEKILESEIKRKDLEVTKEAVESEIQSILRRNKINKKQLRQALKNEGTTYSEYYDFLKSRMERQAIIKQSVTSKIRISDEDIEDYYLNKFGKGKDKSFEYTISHILFNNEVQAKQVYNELLAGASFDNLAEQYSKDTAFTAGGFLGKFKSDEMSKQMRVAVSKLSAGEVSKPVKTAAGIHLFKLNAKRLIANPDLEEKKPQIRNILTQQALKQQFQFWLEQKRKETYIKIN